MHGDSKDGSSSLSRSGEELSLCDYPKQIIPGYEKRLRSFVNWSALQESYIEHLANYEKEKLSGSSFHEALNSKIKSSSFYNFMGDFHCTIKARNYLDIMQMTLWDLEKFGSEEEVFNFMRSNNITDSVEDVIKKSVKDKASLDFKWLQTDVELLRLMNYKVTILDSSLKHFKGIKCLNLSLNYLSNFKGSKLPRQLQMLELQGNFITNVLSLSQSLPESLAYLGLSRNLICDDNNYLTALNTTNISVLDLSDNEIVDLKEILSMLSTVNTLYSLSLDGNPCSFCQIYKDTVVSYIPRLGFLDGIEIEEDDRNPDFNLERSQDNLLTSGVFVFSCYRVMALPEPITDKATVKMYFLEIMLPLLDDILKEVIKYNNVSFHNLPRNKNPEPSALIYDNQTSSSSVQFYDDTSPAPNDKLSITNTVSSDIPKPDSDADIISPLLQLEEIFENQRIKTIKQSWKKLMEFDIPSIIIPCDDLRILRDVFRSKVTVNLICASLNPADLKIPKGKSSTRRKDSKMSQMKAADSTSDGCILDRETVASFHCHLISPKWKTPFLDYQWTENVNSEDADITEGLKGQKYLDKSVKTPAVKRKKGAIIEEIVDLEPPLEIPEELTCHLGFGILRAKQTKILHAD